MHMMIRCYDALQSSSHFLTLNLPQSRPTPLRPPRDMHSSLITSNSQDHALLHALCICTLFTRRNDLFRECEAGLSRGDW